MSEYRCNLLVVIVNYKTPDLVCKSLETLVKELEVNSGRAIIVDNNSMDDSASILSDYIKDNNLQHIVTLVLSDCNGGFAYGNNLAIRDVIQSNNPPEFVYFLNPDAWVLDDAISALLTFMQNKPKIGIVGGGLEDPDGSRQNSSFRFHNWLTEIDRGFNLSFISKLLKPWLSSNTTLNVPSKTDWVAGASMLIRTEVFNDIGLLDESYFMYYEEMDFCLQAARSGWECWYVPDSRVVHYVGQSSGITDYKVQAKRRPTYWFESRRRFFLKNYGVFRAMLADTFWLFGFGTWRLRNFLQHQNHNFPPYFLFDSFMNSVFVKGFKKRPVKND